MHDQVLKSSGARMDFLFNNLRDHLAKQGVPVDIFQGGGGGGGFGGYGGGSGYRFLIISAYFSISSNTMLRMA